MNFLSPSYRTAGCSFITGSSIIMQSRINGNQLSLSLLMVFTCVGILYNLPYLDKPLLRLNPIILLGGYNNLHIKDLQKVLYMRKWILGKANELAPDFPVIRVQIQDLSLGSCSYKAPNMLHFASLCVKDRCPGLALGLKNNPYAFYMCNFSFDHHRSANIGDVFFLCFMWQTWGPDFQRDN